MLCGAASDASSGSPRLTHLPAVPAMEPSSYLDLASFGGTLRRRSELPRFFALSVPPPDSRLRVSPLPQVFRLPAMDLRVSPNSHPFGATASVAPGCPFASPVPPVDELPGFPGGCIFRLRLGRFLRVAPLLHSLCAADWWSSESPRTLHRSARRRLKVQVAPHLHSRQLCRFRVSGFPRFLRPRLDDDDSPLFSNLASITWPGSG